MPQLDSLLAAVLQTHSRLAADLTDAAVRAFLASLGDSRCPSAAERNSAMAAARGVLRDGLLSRDTIAILVGGEVPDENRMAAIALSFGQHVPLLNSPPLPERDEMPPMRLALAALLGAVLGTLIGGPVGIYLLGKGDVGLVVGPPVGAFFTTWALDQASRSKWVAGSLIAALGVATIAEVWAYLSANPLAAVWRRLSGRNSLVRIAIYLLLIALVVFTRRRSTYDRSTLDQSVRQSIHHWLHGALAVLAVLSQRDVDQPANRRQEEEAMAELGKRIMDLHAASAENLSGLAQDVIIAARDAGFEGLEGPVGFSQTSKGPEAQVFEWAESMRERYEVFGHVEPGDPVRVEEEAVVFRGHVRKKGLVRKQRGR